MPSTNYPLGHKIKMAPSLVLQKALALGVVLSVTDGKLHAAGRSECVAELAPELRQHRAELVQLLSQESVGYATPLPFSSAPTAPPTPDPGTAVLMELAMRFCDAIQASDKARKQWCSDIEATPPDDRKGVAAYLRGQLAALPRRHKPKPPPAPPVPMPQTWREHDKADQAHYWSCPQCLTVEKAGFGQRCATGQQLHDAYMEAAAREGRFIGARGRG